MKDEPIVVVDEINLEDDFDKHFAPALPNTEMKEDGMYELGGLHQTQLEGSGGHNSIKDLERVQRVGLRTDADDDFTEKFGHGFFSNHSVSPNM